MKTHSPASPPVDIEQWLDFVIAAAAHRSHDEAQRKFGELLIQRYFNAVPEEYKDDPVARRYLDNMLCAVASAVRGFSVVRDIFATNWESLKEAKEREKARAERIDNFAPFKRDGYWKSALAVIGALGLLSLVLAGLQQFLGSLPWELGLALAVAVLLSLFGMELFVDWLRNRRLAQLETRFPDTVFEMWRDKSLAGYRDVLRHFLLLAIRIREEFYPDLTTLRGGKVSQSYPVPRVDGSISTKKTLQGDLRELDEFIAGVVEQHFAFKTAGTQNSAEVK